jgi:catechol 2,3-dioxygenase-like lactoylglutathione lyase family enzyme
MSKVSVRYMIDDVPAAIGFYTTSLGFTLDHDASPAFASVSRDGVRLLLSGDGSSGKRPLSDGRRQAPGGWNRIHLKVTDLEAEVKRLRAAGVPFRTTEIVSGRWRSGHHRRPRQPDRAVPGPAVRRSRGRIHGSIKRARHY